MSGDHISLMNCGNRTDVQERPSRLRMQPVAATHDSNIPHQQLAAVNDADPVAQSSTTTPTRQQAFDTARWYLWQHLPGVEI